MKGEKSINPEIEGVLSSFSSLPYEDQVEMVSALLQETSRERKVRPSELVFDVAIPFGIFSQKKLSSLEAIVKFLKEVKGMKLALIAKILGRDSSTIWTTYDNASRKMPESYVSVRDEVMIDAYAFSNRKLSILEHVCVFAKNLGYTNHEIALMLLLDDRTIWSVLHRAKRKIGGQL